MSEEKTVEQILDEIGPGESRKSPISPEVEEKGEATAPESTDASESTEEPEAEESQEAAEDEGEEPESEDDPEEEAEPKPKRPSKTTLRMRRLKREAVEAQNAVQERDAQIRVLMEQLQRGQEPAAKAPDATDDAPKQDDFNDYAEYLEARSAWSAREAVRATLAEAHKAAAETQKTQTAQQRETEIATQAKALFAKGADKYEDFQEVAGAEDLPITESMTVAMLESDIGHEIQYHLGNNPDEADRISQLNPVQQVREMAFLEASLRPKEAPKKKTTSAPEPIKPVGGKQAAPKTINEDTMDLGDYMAKFNAGELPSQKLR